MELREWLSHAENMEARVYESIEHLLGGDYPDEVIFQAERVAVKVYDSCNDDFQFFTFDQVTNPIEARKEIISAQIAARHKAEHENHVYREKLAAAAAAAVELDITERAELARLQEKYNA